ncbi:hypothetical protein HELRODRAFT_177434 [Helobdella robusta]|uniref:C-type lectin domain-containing protein n=1 Tax=Helobdella robusta TaxID=6412 RepID=T1FBP5_HELRO|nr:hypothetical protein HELRODRAFT_177434 [Helobdella robusta]ESN98186.1 hypothetical protein HELRODRAFT_177434 [Helobdella robusta]
MILQLLIIVSGFNPSLAAYGLKGWCDRESSYCLFWELAMDTNITTLKEAQEKCNSHFPYSVPLELHNEARRDGIARFMEETEWRREFKVILNAKQYGDDWAWINGTNYVEDVIQLNMSTCRPVKKKLLYLSGGKIYESNDAGDTYVLLCVVESWAL